MLKIAITGRKMNTDLHNVYMRLYYYELHILALYIHLFTTVFPRSLVHFNKVVRYKKKDGHTVSVL